VSRLQYPYEFPGLWFLLGYTQKDPAEQGNTLPASGRANVHFHSAKGWAPKVCNATVETNINYSFEQGEIY
jgi:hypothetical protein